MTMTTPVAETSIKDNVQETSQSVKTMVSANLTLMTSVTVAQMTENITESLTVTGPTETVSINNVTGENRFTTT